MTRFLLLVCDEVRLILAGGYTERHAGVGVEPYLQIKGVELRILGSYVDELGGVLPSVYSNISRRNRTKGENIRFIAEKNSDTSVVDRVVVVAAVLQVE